MNKKPTKLKEVDKLTLKQKLFCEYYLETLGNGAEAAIKAGYGTKQGNAKVNRAVAKSIASENLTKPYILEYLNTLLEKNGLNDQMVSAHHAFLINQYADLSVKLRAIDIYYKLHGKYAAIKVEDGYRNKEIDRALDYFASDILPK